MKLRRLTKEERTEIVVGLIQGKYYPLDTEEKIKLGALPLILGGQRQLDREEIKKIGMVLGDMRHILPGAVNGIPMFICVRLILREDWKLIVDEYNRKIKILKE